MQSLTEFWYCLDSVVHTEYYNLKASFKYHEIVLTICLNVVF